MTSRDVCKVLAVLSLLHLQKGEDLNDNTSNDKFNVVLFLAKTSSSEQYNLDAGIKYLNFVEKARVKHCAPETTTEEEKPPPYSPLGSDCKQLLKTGIYALISYCRNVVGMTTAIASIENDTFSNGLRFKKSTSEDLEIRYHYPRTLSRYRAKSDPMPNSQRFITEPEHTEVFKIRLKRQNQLENLPSPETQQVTDDSGNTWDIFGVMANIKLTFFGKLFEKDKTVGRFGSQNTQSDIMDRLGKVSENSLFELVKETLLNVEDNRECGFLMIIVGGDLKEICDIYSNLMQSVKHVIENTDERNTLIVVTGSCPIIDRANVEEEQYPIPVYVRGPPKAAGIAISGQLYDVPYAIKNLLAEMNGGNYFSGIRTKRESHQTTKKRNNTEDSSLIFPVLLLSYILTLVM